MLDLLSSVFELLHLVSAWRLIVGFTTTVIVCLLCYFALGQSCFAALVAVAVAVTGVILSARWQARAGAV